MNRFKKTVPRMGFIGRVRLREAEVSEDMVALKALLEGALKRLFELEEQEDCWPYVQALFPDHVVVEREGKILQYPYAVDGTEVSFGEPTEVVTTFEPVATALAPAQADPAAPAAEPSGEATFVEAHAQGRGARAFGVRIVSAGLSLNNKFYPDAVLREAVPVMEGARVFIKSDEDHLKGRGTDIRNLAGRMVDVHFKEGRQQDTGALYGTFELMEPEGAVAVKLREAWDNGMANLFGFSIDASGVAVPSRAAGRTVLRATKIDSVDSVDLIVRPGAGGGIVEFKESEDPNPNEDDAVWREKLIEAIQKVAPDLLEGVDVTALTDDELSSLYEKAFTQTAPATTETAPDLEAVFTEAVKGLEARTYMREAVGRCALPEPAKARLRQAFGARIRYTEADVDREIRKEAQYLSSFGGGAVSGLGSLDVTRTPGQGTAKMLDDFFTKRGVRSFKECYVHMTGDKQVTGRTKNCDRVALREALDSQSFDQVLGDAIHRKLLEDYKTQSQYDVWKYLADVVPVDDFRLQHRTRYGGYGDMPIVAESAPYLPLTSPTDEEAQYAVAKRGGTESVTLEMIKNDDVAAISRLPGKLTSAAKRTLSKFVLDFVRLNAPIYDGVNLFDAAAHKNLGTAGLDDATYAAARLAMMQQKEPGSEDKLSIPPKYLWVPHELEQIAYDMFRRDTNLDETFVQSQHPTVVSVWYWEGLDWLVSAALDELPCVEIGFLDGQEEPELFVQDVPNVGSLFTNDVITYKLRHTYGGAVIDYRGLYKSIVA